MCENNWEELNMSGNAVRACRLDRHACGRSHSAEMVTDVTSRVCTDVENVDNIFLQPTRKGEKDTCSMNGGRRSLKALFWVITKTFLRIVVGAIVFIPYVQVSSSTLRCSWRIRTETCIIARKLNFVSSLHIHIVF